MFSTAKFWEPVLACSFPPQLRAPVWLRLWWRRRGTCCSPQCPRQDVPSSPTITPHTCTHLQPSPSPLYHPHHHAKPTMQAHHVTYRTHICSLSVPHTTPCCTHVPQTMQHVPQNTAHASPKTLPSPHTHTYTRAHVHMGVQLASHSKNLLVSSINQ